MSARPLGSAEHAEGPNGEPLDIALHERPEFLIGTFNKIYRYPTGVFADQHATFNEALRSADHLLVIGYGFRDKAINARLVAWAERPGERHMVVVHRNPDGLGFQARGAVRDKWQRWQERGLLAFVRKHLAEDVRWDEVRAQLILS